jgi:GNAT superfamily N-acetyltransferase
MLFYARTAGPAMPAAPVLPSGCTIEVWRPRALAAFPDRFRPVYLVWWLFHHGRIFANRDYSALLIREGGRVVHRSMVFPRFFRFPFMSESDLQIGDTETAEDQRGKGLATQAIAGVARFLHRPGRTLWYLVEESNEASIRVIAKAGFELRGRGRKVPRAGLRLLGAYQLDTVLPGRNED